MFQRQSNEYFGFKQIEDCLHLVTFPLISLTLASTEGIFFVLEIMFPSSTFAIPYLWRSRSMSCSSWIDCGPNEPSSCGTDITPDCPINIRVYATFTPF